MDSSPIRSVALLSIHPKFAKRILSGQKAVEFRKAKFQREVSHVVIYASNPVQSVLGYFEVDQIDEGLPCELWDRYAAIAGTLHEEFEGYFSSCNRGVAIKIGTVNQLRSPLPLSAIDETLSAPQSFTYLDHKVFDTIRRLSW